MAISEDTFNITGFARNPKVLTGTAYSFARRYELSPAVVRACLISLTLVGGVGLLLYWVAWRRTISSVGVGERAEPERGATSRRSLAFVLLTVAIMQVGDAVGITVGEIHWATLFVSLGCFIAWDASIGDEGTRNTGLRLLLGGFLGILGVLMVMSSLAPLGDIIDSLLIGGGLTLAVGLILGPKLWEVATTAIDERQERIRSEEREAVAAHLHDSVLQTLTLIQRHAADPHAHPRTVATLARRQERDLRRWLYGRSTIWEPGTRLRDTFEALGAEIEDRYGVSIELVIVGDAAMRNEWQPLIGATREALTNAAKFAGEHTISLFVEVQRHTPDPVDEEHRNSRRDPLQLRVVESVQVFVRDRGPGFDVNAISHDRRGIRDSIIGRLQRSGGTVAITSTADTGTEIEMRLTSQHDAEVVEQGMS